MSEQANLHEDIPRIEFIYVRHGQTDYNLRNLLQGASDIPLNDTGRKQARDAANAMNGLSISSAYASPRLRAYETAQIICDPHGVTVQADMDLREPDFGVAEGNPDDGKYHEWRRGEVSYEGADVYQDQLDWIARGLKNSLSTDLKLNRDGMPLLVAHGGVFWAMRDVLGLPGQEDLKNATPIRVFPTNSGGWDFEYIPLT